MIRMLLAASAVLLFGVVPVGAAEFDHGAHLANVTDATCVTCHGEKGETLKPDSKVCQECHDAPFIAQVTFPAPQTHGPLWSFNHRPAAKLAAIDCAACHQQDFCLECHKAGRADEMGQLGNRMANVHRSEFSVTHPLTARTNPQLCSSCHEKDFCVECHESFAPEDLRVLSHRRGWSDLRVSGAAHADFAADSCQICHPGSVLPAHEWSNAHAREARKDLASCQACHPDGDECLRCHSANFGLRVNPHPKNWSDVKNRLDHASRGQTCRKCH